MSYRRYKRYREGRITNKTALTEDLFFHFSGKRQGKEVKSKGNGGDYLDSSDILSESAGGIQTNGTPAIMEYTPKYKGTLHPDGSFGQSIVPDELQPWYDPNVSDDETPKSAVSLKEIDSDESCLKQKQESRWHRLDRVREREAEQLEMLDL